MTRSIPMLLIGLVFGALIGFLLTATYGTALGGDDHADDHGGTSQNAAHDMGAMEVIDLEPAVAPVVKAIIHPDPMGGWNLEVQTTNFRFSPENVSTQHIEGEGHAHVFVNGKKVARIYGPWMQLTGVQSGDVISVGLNANNHKALAVNGQPITATATIP